MKKRIDISVHFTVEVDSEHLPDGKVDPDGFSIVVDADAIGLAVIKPDGLEAIDAEFLYFETGQALELE